MSAIDSEKTPEINDVIRWNILQKRTCEVRALQAFRLFNRNGIDPVLVKGLAAALSYPDSVTRSSVDIDLAVSGEHFSSALRLARSDAAQGLGIDLHCELRHLDTIDWQDLFANSRLHEVGDGTIRLLRPEDHLRVLCVHWLTDGGVYRERLWDIYYAIENRAADFDWTRFLDVVTERRRRWLICTVGLAHRYLGLDLAGTPIEADARNLPEWFIQAVEKEWANETKPWPLEMSLHDKKLLAKQIKRRFRPNPIWATVQMEGSFDARTRVFYQVGNFFRRIPSSYRRVSETLTRRAQ